MTLQKEDRIVLVALRLKKAKETLVEVKGNIELGFWRVVANRLYYACFYAVNALLIKNGYNAHTHAGVITQFGLHFVSKGIMSIEQGKLYKYLFEKRLTGDYDDWTTISKQDIVPLLEPAEQFIAAIENLINNDTENN
jgi:uncharacterized protein (UPF0332 family)